MLVSYICAIFIKSAYNPQHALAWGAGAHNSMTEFVFYVCCLILSVIQI